MCENSLVYRENKEQYNNEVRRKKEKVLIWKPVKEQ